MSQVGRNYLYGTASSASAVDFIKFRRQAADFFLDVEFARLGFDLQDLKVIKDHLKDHEIYRQSVTSRPDSSESLNNQWQSSLKISGIKVLRLMEDGDDG